MAKNKYFVEIKSIDDLPTMAKTMGSMMVNETGSWRNVYPLLEKDSCIKCGICWKFCPDVVITEDADGYPVFNLDYCKGCGVCANECPKSCIAMIEEGK